MPSIEERAGEPKPVQKEYTEVIRSDVEIDRKFVDENGLPAKILYYCRDSKKLVNPQRIGKKFKFSCSVCKGDRVAFGSEASLRNFYRIPVAQA